MKIGKFPVSLQVTKGKKGQFADVKLIWSDDPPPADGGQEKVASPEPAEGAESLGLVGVEVPKATSASLQSEQPDVLASAPRATELYSTSSDSPLPPDFSRHARRCIICSHPDRDAIEAEFVRWGSPVRIAQEFQISDRASLYRHAHATGLFARRRSQFARVLEDILQCVEHCSLEETADVIIRAARLYSHLDENGNWLEPARTHIILTGPAPPQSVGNPEIEVSAAPQPPTQPGRLPLKLARKLTRGSKAKKKLIATHRNSKKKATP